MKQRPKGFLDPYIIDSLVDRGFRARWHEIKEDLLLKLDVDDKTFSAALKRLEDLGIIRKDNDIYYLLPKLPIPGEPFQIIKGYNYIQTLKIWADEISVQENTGKKTEMLAKYLFRTWANITSLYLNMLEKYIETQSEHLPEKDTEIRARKRSEEYLDKEMMVLAALMKKTARLFVPPKKPRIPILTGKTKVRMKISKQEINMARRIILATLARELPEETIIQVMTHNCSRGIDLTGDAFGFKDSIFSWNEIPGKDNEKLIEFLKEDFDINWVKIVKMAKIEKVDDGTTIRISTEKNSLSLKLNDDKTRVTLEIDDGRTHEFTVMKEKGKRNIYYRN
ncbi:MAG TPA: hypothetical protein VKL21_03045 [Candidatus Methanoperedens sp.]|nr:hypothetical protein [Candidatus Methanoperedens sp.]